MTTDLFAGFVEQMRPLRAERLLNLANAAHPSEEWVDRMTELLHGDDSDGGGEARVRVRQSPFRLTVRENGKLTFDHAPITTRALRQQLAFDLGGGFSDERPAQHALPASTVPASLPGLAQGRARA